MTDIQMGIGAVVVELGLPLGLLILMAIKPSSRPRAIVVLGAVFPALCLYGVVTVGHLVSRGKSESFAFFAMWVMTFAAYMAVTLGGVAVSFFKKPSGSLARFGMGLLSAPFAYFCFAFL